MTDAEPTHEPGDTDHGIVGKTTKLDPEGAIRNDADAWFLVVIWAIKKTFPAALLFGFAFAGVWVIVVEHDGERFLDRFQTDTGNIWSPFFFVVVVIGARFVLGWIALAGAYPLSRGITHHDYPSALRMNRHIRAFWDRWKMSQAYRAFRWTWAVHDIALRRTGRTRTIWQWWDGIMVGANIVLGITAFVIFVIAASLAPELVE